MSPCLAWIVFEGASLTNVTDGSRWCLKFCIEQQQPMNCLSPDEADGYMWDSVQPNDCLRLCVRLVILFDRRARHERAHSQSWTVIRLLSSCLLPHRHDEDRFWVQQHCFPSFVVMADLRSWTRLTYESHGIPWKCFWDSSIDKGDVQSLLSVARSNAMKGRCWCSCAGCHTHGWEVVSGASIDAPSALGPFPWKSEVAKGVFERTQNASP